MALKDRWRKTDRATRSGCPGDRVTLIKSKMEPR